MPVGKTTGVAVSSGKGGDDSAGSAPEVASGSELVGGAGSVAVGAGVGESGLVRVGVLEEDVVTGVSVEIGPWVSVGNETVEGTEVAVEVCEIVAIGVADTGTVGRFAGDFARTRVADGAMVSVAVAVLVAAIVGVRVGV